MEILELREKREQFEKDLIEETQGTLVTIRANYPGSEKRNELATLVVREMEKLLQEKLPIILSRETSTKEGLVVYLVTYENPQGVKQYCIELEDHHRLGRLADLDVRSQNKSWSREDFHQNRRKCYLCEKDAVVCTRSQSHPRQEVLDFFHNTVDECRNSGS